MVTDGADTSDAVARRVARQPQGAVDSGVHRSASARSASRATSRSRASRRRARRSRARRSPSTSSSVADRLRRRRRCRSTSKTKGASSARRRSRCRPTASRRPCASRFTATDAGARLFRFQMRAAGRRAGHAEQRARRAGRGRATAREKVLYFEGEPRFEAKFIRRAVEDDKNLAGRHPAAHGRGQVPAARRRQPRRAGRRLPEDARGAVRLPRASSWAASKRRRSRPISCACSPTS